MACGFGGRLHDLGDGLAVDGGQVAGGKFQDDLVLGLVDVTMRPNSPKLVMTSTPGANFDWSWACCCCVFLLRRNIMKMKTPSMTNRRIVMMSMPPPACG